jgi:transposase InsO family protein
VKYAWIEEHRERFPVGRMCVLLGASRSGFDDWLDRPPCERSRSDERLAVELRARYARHRGKYGRPRLTVDLHEAGFRVNHKRVHRLMLREGLYAMRPRRFVRTTDSRHGFVPAPNGLGQVFQDQAPNKVWRADITYVGTDEGWLYLALVLDLYSRRLVAWAMSATIDQKLTAAALALALGTRHPGPGCCTTPTVGCSTAPATIAMSSSGAASPYR